MTTLPGRLEAHVAGTWYPGRGLYTPTMAYGTGAAWAISKKSRLKNLPPGIVAIDTPLDGTMRLFVDMAFAPAGGNAVLATDAPLTGVNLANSLKALDANGQEYKTFMQNIGNSAQYGVYSLVVDAIESTGTLAAADPDQLARVEQLKTFSAELLKTTLVKALSRALFRGMMQGVGRHTAARDIKRVPGPSGFNIIPSGVVFPFWLLRPRLAPAPRSRVRVGDGAAYAVNSVEPNDELLLRLNANSLERVRLDPDNPWMTAGGTRIEPADQTLLILYPDVVCMVGGDVLVSELKTTAQPLSKAVGADDWYQARMQALACWTQLKAGNSPLAGRVKCQLVRAFNDSASPQIDPTVRVATADFGADEARLLVMTVMLLSLLDGDAKTAIWALPATGGTPLRVYPAGADPGETITVYRIKTPQLAVVTRDYALVLASLRDNCAYRGVASAPIVSFFTTAEPNAATPSFTFNIQQQPR